MHISIGYACAWREYFVHDYGIVWHCFYCKNYIVAVIQDVVLTNKGSQLRDRVPFGLDAPVYFLSYSLIPVHASASPGVAICCSPPPLTLCWHSTLQHCHLHTWHALCCLWCSCPCSTPACPGVSDALHCCSHSHQWSSIFIPAFRHVRL